MMTISGRHIRKAMVERRRMKSRKLRLADACASLAALQVAGDHVWTVSAIHAADPFGSASAFERCTTHAGPKAGMRSCIAKA